MGGDDVPAPGQPEPSGKTDQEIFDEPLARASGKTVVIFGGWGSSPPWSCPRSHW